MTGAKHDPAAAARPGGVDPAGSRTGGVDPAGSRTGAGRLRAIGPGIIFAVAVLGAGSFVSNAAAGATYGYSLLWVLAVAVLFRFVWLEASARYVLVTGEPLLAGYARVHRSLLWVVLIAFVIAGHLYGLYAAVILGFAAQAVLPLPWHGVEVWGLAWVIIGYGAMIAGGYAGIEKLCRLFMVVMGVTLALIAVLSRPDPVAVAQGLLVPSLPGGNGVFATLLIVGALIGTEAGSLSNVMYSYFGIEKGWRGSSAIQRMRLDLGVGTIALLVMGALLQIAAAGALYGNSMPFENVQDLLRIFSDRLGRTGELIFALGLWATALSTFIGGYSGYGVVAADTWREIRRRSADSLWASGEEGAVRRTRAYRVLVAFWVFSPLYALLLGWEPIGLALVVNVLVMTLVPVLAIALLRLTTSHELMGEHRNGPIANAGLVLLILASLYLLLRNIVEWSTAAV